MNKSRWLDIIEQLALLSTVIGSVTSVVYGQIIYFASPLCLSMFLNLINRYQGNQNTQQKTLAAIMLVDQDLFRVKQSIQKLNHKHENIENSLNQFTAELEKINQLFNQRNEVEQIEELEKNLTKLSEKIIFLQEIIYQQIHPPTPVPNMQHKSVQTEFKEELIQYLSAETPELLQPPLVWGDISQGKPEWGK